MLYQPGHHRVVHWDLPLDPLLRRQHHGAGQPLERPHRVLNGPVGPRLVRRRRLEHGLHPQALGNGPTQVDQR
eukprot:1243759-Alexandrium_andersonii.AAC.1